jgi:tetratricopeptide (TPR) repeat protein
MRQYQYNQGVSLMKQGKLDEAIRAFNDAVANSARMFEGYVNLGYIYFKKGDLDKVVEYNKKAIEMEPDMRGDMPIWDLPIFR